MSRDNDAARILDAARRRSRALVERDAAALAALHHPRLRWTTFRGDVLDRESYIRGNTDGSLAWIEQNLRDPEVVVEGDSAILTGVVEDTVDVDGVSETFVLRLTQTWVRVGEAWLCIAGHAGPRIA